MTKQNCSGFSAIILIIVLAIIVGGGIFAYSKFNGSNLLGNPKSLYEAMKDHDKNGFEALLNAGADPNAPITLTGPRGDKYTETIMRFAAESEDNYYLRLLLEHGGNPNARDNLGFPILFDTTHTSSDYYVKNHYSILWNNFDILIAKGADINAIGRGNNIITELLTFKFYTDIEKILNKYPGVNFKYKNSSGISLISLEIQKTTIPEYREEARKRIIIWLEQHGVIFPALEQ